MKLIIANWKNNPDSVAEAIELAEATDYENLVICPPNSFLEDVRLILKKAKLGMQDLPSAQVRERELGRSAVKIEYVIVGHSDRRKLGETNEMIAEKIKVVVDAGLIPILCVGETLEQKTSGQKEKIISEQVRVSLSQIRPDTRYPIPEIYIAYEPVWSISTNPNAEVDTPENVLETIDFIKSELVNLDEELASKIKFLYGGSVNSKNIESFISYSEISGVLVGGASLKPEEVKKMVEVTKKY